MKKLLFLLFVFIILELILCSCDSVNNSISKTNDNTGISIENTSRNNKPDKTKSNQTGNDIKYTINKKTKTLIVSGKGPIYQLSWGIISSTEKKPVFPVRIIISRGATLIGDYAFDNGSNGLSEEGRNGLDKVQEVKIPNTVTQIGKEAFHHLISLNSVTIPNTVTWIGEGAFSECISLKKVELSSQLEELPKESFYYCKSLKEITIPMSVKAIADDAFLFTDKLTIKGYKGTAAEKYAEKNGFKFVALD